MRYVERNQAGDIVARFATLQPGRQLEAIADDHADIVALERAAYRAEALRRIDAEAETVRLRFLTPGAGQAAVYLRKADEAERLGGDQSPDPADYPLLAASVGVEIDPQTDAPAADLAAVAAIVLATRDAWLTAAAAIEAQRLGAKASIDALADPADQAAIDAILAGLVWPAP